MNLKRAILTINKLMKSKKDLSVGQIYGELYNTKFLRDFILSMQLNSMEIVLLVYSVYFMNKNPELTVDEAIETAKDRLREIITVQVQYQEPEMMVCEECDGDGEITCSECNGEGEVECSSCDGTGEIEGETCDDCGGSGTRTCWECDDHGVVSCDECGGSGEIESGQNSIQYHKEYWLTTSVNTTENLESRDEPSYYERDEFEELLDSDEKTTLFLGYVSDRENEVDFVQHFGLDIDSVEDSDNFFISISKPQYYGPLMRLVGYSKFGKMI
jgi:hypothetical protein